MESTIDSNSAYIKATNLCSRSEQCSSDIASKLSKWGIEIDEASRIVKRLIDENFIDDARYACAFARDKAYFEGWGKIKIKYALRQKRICDNDIEDALFGIDDQRYNESMKRSLMAKARSVSKREQAKAKAALYRFAASRGYEIDLARIYINRFFSTDDCDECYRDI